MSQNYRKILYRAAMVFCAFSLAGRAPQLSTDVEEDYLLMSGLSSGKHATISEKTIHKYLIKNLRETSYFQVGRLTHTIAKLARKYSLNPKLILAVIKVESRFRPWAVSNKGALGLMQIMPETGEWLAKLNHMNWAGPLQLLDPEINVKLGVSYLAFLRDRYKGDVRAFLSAFNAGPTNFEKQLVLGKGYQTEYLRMVRASL